MNLDEQILLIELELSKLKKELENDTKNYKNFQIFDIRKSINTCIKVAALAEALELLKSQK